MRSHRTYLGWIKGILWILMFGMPVIPALAGCNEWTSNGPYGGYIYSIAVAPSNPLVLYAGLFGPGAYRSTDGGETWVELAPLLSTPPPGPYNIMCWAIHPLDPCIAYVGEANYGIFKTTNGGASWVPVINGLQDVRDCTQLLINPAEPETLYAIYHGQVCKTTNGGSHWQVVLPYTEISSIRFIALDPRDDKVLYVAGGQSDHQGVFWKSSDSGQTWRPLSEVLPGEMILFEIDPTNNSIVYGTLALDGRGPFFKSNDGGLTWVESNQGLPTYGWPEGLVLDPSDSSTMYLSLNLAGIFKSTDAGATWVSAGYGLWATRYYKLAMDPSSPSTLYLAAGDGVYKTTDGAVTWQDSSRGIQEIWAEVIAFDNIDKTTFIASTQRGLFKTQDAGITWDLLRNGLPVGGVECFAMNPQDSSILYAATAEISSTLQYLFKSTDGGDSWADITGDLPVSVWYGVDEIAINPEDTRTIYAITLLGAVSKSVDGGATWFAAREGLPEDIWVQTIALAPSSPDIAYISSVELEPGVGSRIYKSLNGGASWTECSNGMPSQSYQTPFLIVDPWDANIVYASTEVGIYMTLNGGAVWSILGGLPALFLYPIAIDPGPPETLYMGWPDGVSISRDRGATWASLPSRNHPPYLVGHPFLNYRDPVTIYLASMNGICEITQAPVPGDCDGDVSVSIGEVQRTINMFLGAVTPACGVDKDGDGTVSIGEVQGVINGFLGTADPCE